MSDFLRFILEKYKFFFLDPFYKKRHEIYFLSRAAIVLLKACFIIALLINIPSLIFLG